MARRKGDLILLLEAATNWPWKISVALAVFSFIACRLIVLKTAKIAAPAGLANLGSTVIWQGSHAFASILQYLLPLIFIIAAGLSIVRRARSKSLLADVQRGAVAAVSALSWEEFERLVGEGFRQKGFAVTERGGAAPDGGIDLELRRGSEKFLVQCKKWRARQVGVSIVRELYGVISAERAAGGFLVTAGTFTRDALAFASGRDIELTDGKALSQLLDIASNGTPKARIKTAPKPNAGLSQSGPICPSCKAPMVKRVAGKGKNVGAEFWGCANFPKCRHTVAI